MATLVLPQWLVLLCGRYACSLCAHMCAGLHMWSLRARRLTYGRWTYGIVTVLTSRALSYECMCISDHACIRSPNRLPVPTDVSSKCCTQAFVGVHQNPWREVGIRRMGKDEDRRKRFAFDWTRHWWDANSNLADAASHEYVLTWRYAEVGRRGVVVFDAEQ